MVRRSDAMRQAAGMLPEEWDEVCRRLGQPEYRAAQALGGIFRRRAFTFDEISDLPRRFRDALPGEVAFPVSIVERVHASPDGTRKLLVRLDDGNAVETVLIPMSGKKGPQRVTVCISTQVGCAVGCSFCASGIDGLARNLTAAEIVEQFLHANRHVSYCGRIGRLVFMGMGEPLHNIDAVQRALRILTASWGGRIGARKITVSTVGPAQGIRKLARGGIPVNLAVSLHAPTTQKRVELVPTGREDVTELAQAASDYFESTGREVTFEYVLLDGVNDAEADAEDLASLLHGRRCTVNLIPYNRVTGLPYDAPKPARVRTFRDVLRARGVVAKVRRRRGDEVNAACGQLRRQHPLTMNRS